MSEWWWSRGEAGDRYGEGDRLYDESIRLLHSGDDAGSEAAAIAAVRAYREVWESTGAVEAKRRLAKALWRQASVLTKSGRPSLALEPGLEGIPLGREVLEATPPDHAAFDSIVCEVAIAMNDLAQAAGRTQRLDLYLELLQQAVRVSRQGEGPAAREALGTSLHNLAQCALEMCQGIRSRQPEAALGYLQLALDSGKGALEVRESLLAATGAPLHRWELANTLRLTGELQCLATDPTGLDTLNRAQRVLAGFDFHGYDELRAEISQRVAVMEQVVAFAAQQSAATSAAPERPCPCGSNLPFARCHGQHE